MVVAVLRASVADEFAAAVVVCVDGVSCLCLLVLLVCCVWFWLWLMFVVVAVFIVGAVVADAVVDAVVCPIVFVLLVFVACAGWLYVGVDGGCGCCCC